MGTPTDRRARIGRRESEQLITGVSGGAAGAPGPEQPELTHLLRAAAQPGYRDELAGEEAAVALFARHYEMGRTGAPGEAYRLLERRAAPRRGLAYRMAVAFAVLIVGGLVTGAETGLLPAALQAPAHRLFSPLGVPGASTSVGHGSQPGTAGRSGYASASPNSHRSPVPPSALLSACRRYEAGGKTAVTPAELAELRTTAGGTGKISAYCAGLLRTTASPTRPGKAKSPKPGKT
ncbi:MAG TPA: hypothetical protein VJT31_28790 [Rugosimonospora sp.]|nr:hypothetical protein [Rugosimonospora sp.]